VGFFNRPKLSKDSFQLSLNKTELSLGDEVKGTLSIKSDAEFDIEKIWIRLTCEESSGKNHAILYDNDNLDLSDAIHVNAGFHKEFPFVLKLPSVGRETYHSIHQNVRWLVDVYIKVKGMKYAISTEGGREILVQKPTAPTIPITQVKEAARYPTPLSSKVMNLYCPNCGKEVPNEDAIFCPYCSKPLRLAKKQSGFPTAAGILTIIAACATIVIGIFGFLNFASYYPYYSRYYVPYWFDNLFIGIWSTICFAVGLSAAIYSIKRTRFVLSIIGTSLLLVTPFVVFTESSFSGLEVFGIPVLILSLLSVVFVSISKGEFT
jgi:DNA-directed RNA polymerase subunit RPC12/RpoP